MYKDFKKNCGLENLMLVSLTPQDILVPLTVPLEMRPVYIDHMLAVTKKTGRLFLFAADQKIEHLNTDFYGDEIPEECADPEYLFKNASRARIGAFATHLGLIARYAFDYRAINYIVKLNGKSNLVTTAYDDPLSLALTSVDQVVQLKKENNLAIAGVGYTIYLGSAYEAQMLTQAAQIIEQAHAQGLLVILWIYPQGSKILLLVLRV